MALSCYAHSSPRRTRSSACCDPHHLTPQDGLVIFGEEGEGKNRKETWTVENRRGSC